MSLWLSDCVVPWWCPLIHPCCILIDTINMGGGGAKISNIYSLNIPLVFILCPVVQQSCFYFYKVVAVNFRVSAKLFCAKIVIYQRLSRYGQDLAWTLCKMKLAQSKVKHITSFECKVFIQLFRSNQMCFPANMFQSPNKKAHIVIEAVMFCGHNGLSTLASTPTLDICHHL